VTVHSSLPAPWVRPSWFVALCVTDGVNQPAGFSSPHLRDQWLRVHARTFPDHEIHLFHSPEGHDHHVG
jgi:hypothetical protein